MNNNDWNPDAPKVGQDFVEVKDSAPKQETEKIEQIPGKIATAAELEMRKAVQKNPAPEMNLTIGGSVEKAVHQKEFEDNKRMVEYLENRLGQIDLEEDFDRAR